jgi:hypothetical protein
MEIVLVVMGGVASQAKVIEQFADLAGPVCTPLEIGCIELYALVSHLCYGTKGAFEVLLKRFAN